MTLHDIIKVINIKISLKISYRNLKYRDFDISYEKKFQKYIVIMAELIVAIEFFATIYLLSNFVVSNNKNGTLEGKMNRK